HALAAEAIEGAVPVQSGIEAVNHVPRDVKISVDKEQMFRVLLNLCRNAVEALDVLREGVDRQPRIEISARREHGNVVIEVADNGPGLPPTARERLFEPFRGSVRAGGSDLGLAIAADIVRA